MEPTSAEKNSLSSNTLNNEANSTESSIKDLVIKCDFTQLDKISLDLLLHPLPFNQNYLFIAASKLTDDISSMNMIKFLIQKGLNPLHLDDYRQTVLYYTCAAGHVETTKYLLSNFQFDVNHIDINNQTPLNYAVKYNRVEIANLLYSVGFNINHIDNYGENLYYSLRGNSSVEIAQWLYDKGVDISNIGRDGITFFQFANKIGWFNILNVIEGNKDIKEEMKMYKIVKKDNGKPLSEKEEAELFERNIDIYNKLINRDEDYYGKIEQKREVDESEENLIKEEEEHKKEIDESNEQSVSSDFVDINKE